MSAIAKALISLTSMQPNQQNPLYLVSMGKFTLMFFCTLGYYKYYWFFRNWKAIELELGRPLFPAIRSIASPFFISSLLRHIGSRQQAKQVEYQWQPEFLSWFYIITLALEFVLQMQIIFNEGSFLLLQSIGVLSMFLNYYVLYKVQLVCNRVEDDPFGKANSQLTFPNKLWLVFGAYLWIKTISDVYLVTIGEEEPPYKRVDAPPVSGQPIEDMDVGDLDSIR